jgi:aerobic-type carbon monoxide dehydrogenase small subunit (CoxS/CutS family)
VGREITTIEGLGSPESLSAVQQAFWQEDALQCGFCTAGLVVSTTALLEGNPEASEDEVREACAGHLCRCGTYHHVFDAALRAGRELGTARREGGGR